MSCRFWTTWSNVQIGTKTDSKITSFHNLILFVDFATFREWKIREWKKENQVWVPKSLDQSKIEFWYETVWADHLEPKMCLLHVHMDRMQYKTAISLHTLATGPPVYQIEWKDMVLTFECRMYQECHMEIVLDAKTEKKFLVPTKLKSRTYWTSFWLQDVDVLDIFYCSPFGPEHTRKASAQKQWLSRLRSTSNQWSTRFSFLDHTRNMETSVLLLIFNCTHKFIVPFMQQYNPRQPCVSFIHENQLVKISGNLRIKHGPLYWPMPTGRASDTHLLSGTCKRFFPLPKQIVLPLVPLPYSLPKIPFLPEPLPYFSSLSSTISHIRTLVWLWVLKELDQLRESISPLYYTQESEEEFAVKYKKVQDRFQTIWNGLNVRWQNAK